MTECVIVLRVGKSNIRLARLCVCVCVCLCVCVCVVGGGVERHHLYGYFEKQIY